MYLPKKGFPGKLSEFSIFLAWPAILDIYSHGLLSAQTVRHTPWNPNIDIWHLKKWRRFLIFHRCILHHEKQTQPDYYHGARHRLSV